MTTRQLVDQRRNGTTPPQPARPHAVLANLDLILATIGVAGAAVAIIVLASWPWALLAVSTVLILSSLVVPEWD